MRGEDAGGGSVSGAGGVAEGGRESAASVSDAWGLCLAVELRLTVTLRPEVNKMLETIRQWVLTISLVVLAAAALVAVVGDGHATAVAATADGPHPECHVANPTKNVPEAVEQTMRDHAEAGRRAGMIVTGTGSMLDPRVVCAW